MLSLALALIPLVQAPTEVSVRAAIPAEALASLYTPDAGATREAFLGSPWFRFYGEGPGRPQVAFVAELMQELFGERDSEALERWGELARALEGEALVYVPGEALVVVLHGGVDEELDALLRALPEPLGGFEVTPLDVAVGREMWISKDAGGLRIARARGARSVIVFGPSPAACASELSAALARLEEGAPAPAALRLESQLADEAPTLAFDIDLRAIAALAVGGDEDLNTLLEGLGLDRECFLSGAARQEEAGLSEHLLWSFGADTGFARLMSSFSPVEVSDLRTLPAGTKEFSLMRWSPRVFLDSLVGLFGERGEELREAALDAGEAALGVRFDRDVLAYLDGRLAFYQRPLDGGPLDLTDPLLGQSLQVGVSDGAALEESFARLLEASGAEEVFELESFGDHDVWVPLAGEAEGLSLPRLVFTDEALLIVAASEDLGHALAPFGEGARPSLSDESPAVEALRANSGAFYFSYHKLSSQVALSTQQVFSAAELMEHDLGRAPSWEELQRWFPETGITSGWHSERGVEVFATIR